LFKILNRYIVHLFGALFALAIVLYTITYTVRFTETAVRTTFGAAGEGAVQDEPGLKFKWPYPVQSVTKYDKRGRLVQTRSETQQTADDFQIIVEAYMTYRVTDALKFFQSFSDAGDRSVDHYRKAENEVLRDRLRSQLGETSKYRVDELFTAEAQASRIPALEARLKELMMSGGGGDGGTPLSDYGIEIITVGIDRIVFPEGTTTRVIERMRANRDRLAQRYQSEGEAVADSIRAEAGAARDKIRAFAGRRAQEIRAKGEREAAVYLAQQNSNPELAVFLENIDLMKTAMAKRATLVLSTSDFGLGIFSPDVLKDLTAGEIPTQLPGGSIEVPGGALDITSGGGE
jgi:membrane protease subunit HflC